MTSALAANLALIESRIDAACEAAGRDRSEVRLLPVSKTKSPEVVREAVGLGYRRFGENKAQEAHEKWQALSDVDIDWVVIGHLQTNKAKLVSEFATEFQALDSLRLAAELNKRLEAADRQLDVLVQVNSSGEPQKFGIAPEEAAEFTRELRSFEALRVKGLMTLAVFSDNATLVGQCFTRMQQVQRELQDRDGDGWAELSMGMSGDFELAIAHGATCVRVGQAIFGDRLDPDQYWPGING